MDGTDYSRIDNGYLNHLTGWANGDFNYDGVVDGSDYTFIDNAFNSQGASLAALLASSNAVDTAQAAVPVISSETRQLRSIVDRKKNVSEKPRQQSRKPSFVPNIFNAGTPISIPGALDASIELSLQRRDVLDALTFNR